MKRISLGKLSSVPLDSAGLSDELAEKQRDKFGDNSIVDSGENQWVQTLRDSAGDPMVWFLVGVGILFFIVGQKIEGVTLLLAILPLMTMDIFLHWRTTSATGSLKRNLTTVSTVIRNSVEKEVPSKDLVPGDLIKIKVGEFVPADGLLQESSELQVDESALTGEAFPIKKHRSDYDLKSISDDDVMVDELTVVFAGTRVLTGNAKVRIVDTGKNTSYGEIVRSVAEMPHERTPLQLSLTKLVRGLVVSAVGFCLLLAVIRLFQGHGWMDAILSAGTLAVAALPEEFPLVFTFFIGVGVYRLAQRRALVRRGVSVENIGRVTHICTDKTGTITLGQLELSELIPSEASSQEELLKASAVASNPQGLDPLDRAVFDLFSKKLPKEMKWTAEKRFPFTEDRKKETALYTHDGALTAYCKGAPDTVLALCTLSNSEIEKYQQQISKWASSGHKVLACAKKVLDTDNVVDEPSANFHMLGLMTFKDPPRPEVKSSIAQARGEGIKVIMITGDHPVTATAIAKEVGLGGSSPKVVSAERDPDQFQQKFLEENEHFLSSLDVVARCTPVQKLRIVMALKNQGHLVAVTGDGVNDVPALKAADIGIAMGVRGTQSAKEVSSIILGDDNFKTIMSAVHEGRQLFSNLRKAFEYLLYIHIPLVLSAAFIPLLGYPVVYLPIHIVWLELIIHPTAILGFQAVAKNKTRLPSSSFFTRAEVVWIAGIGFVFTAAIMWLFIKNQEVTEVARTQALLALSLWSGLVTALLTKLSNLTSKLVVLWTVGISLLLMQVQTPVTPYLHVVDLDFKQLMDVGLAVGMGSILILLFILRRRQKGVV